VSQAIPATAPGLPSEIEAEFRKLRVAARTLRQLSAEDKNQALESIAGRVSKESALILSANAEDLARLPEATSPAFRDRLALNEARINHMVESLRQVASLTDPVGEVVESKRLANGLEARRVRAPLGVIFMIFESRPNVILEAFSLAFKSGNAIALRGGSDSRSTATVIYRLMREMLMESGVDAGSFYGLDNYDRPIVEALLKRADLIDIAVPRGGEKLIELVTRTAVMPIIKNDRGLCHAYVDVDADLEMSVRVVANAKTQRPGVCNSLETVLVNEKIAAQFLPMLFEACKSAGEKWKCDDQSFSMLKLNGATVERAVPADWDTEHLDQILNCRIVKSLEEALAHIEKHGSRHSETILTRNEKLARHFQAEVDAAAVYWNASTRFTDGFELGLGGELGISTQKLHVRGPVGLKELTTPRWIIDGTGQIRE
jgi:glutamate-5-semialdehyde dehydrogenase